MKKSDSEIRRLLQGKERSHSYTGSPQFPGVRVIVGEATAKTGMVWVGGSVRPGRLTVDVRHVGVWG